RRAQIPYSFYKQDGLWQAEEARHLGCLLKALARPEERQSLTRALLTRFFRIEPTMLAQCDDLPPRHPARLLFQQWADFAAERDWARLFDSLLDDSGLLHHELLREPDGERRLANYRHILHVLEQEGYSRGLDLHGLIHVFEARQARDGDVEGANYHPIETQRCKVKILTIHASKGLEYPVVFLAGGFTDRGADKVTMYRDSDRRVVFDLAPDDHALAEAKNERDAEQRRLYYVALTRAMVRVYVPWVSVTSGRQPGPLVSIVAPALGQSAVNELAAPVAHVLECPLRPRSGRGAARPLTGAKCAGGPPLRLDDPSLVFPRLDADLSRRRVVV